MSSDIDTLSVTGVLGTVFSAMAAVVALGAFANGDLIAAAALFGVAVALYRSLGQESDSQ